MPTLHALFVGINEYSNPQFNLRGCINDLEEFSAYIKACYEPFYDLHFQILKNEDATRANVIKGLQNLQVAKDGDFCLFFFAGHGSYWKAPDEFSHLEPDGKLVSMVCYDSRHNGILDLMNKELSHLIWEITYGKQVHFLAITDCCHSKSMFRNMEGVRMIGGQEVAFSVEQLYKYEEYEKREDGKLTPKIGQFIHLAACLENQTAKEVYTKKRFRGIFTYCLIEALRGSQNHISYAEIIGMTSIRIRSNVYEQSAQLDLTDSLNKDLLFLSNKSAEGIPVQYINYEKDKGWIVSMGAIHGLIEGTEQAPNVFQLETDGALIQTTTIHPAHALVEGMEAYPKNKVFEAYLLQKNQKTIPVGLAKGSNLAVVDLLEKELKSSKSSRFSLVPREQAAYLIHANEKELSLTPNGEERPLFKRVKGQDLAAVIDFLNKLEKVFNWVQLSELKKEQTRIRPSEYSIEVYRITEPGNDRDDAPKELVDWREAIYLYNQRDTYGEVLPPAFQFKVKNTGHRSLWFSLLFLADDFGISNQLLPNVQLAPGQEAWALDADDEGLRYKTLLVGFDASYYDWNIRSVPQYMKLFICTEEFSTNDFVQKPLDLEYKTTPLRKVLHRNRIQRPDWTVKDICLIIEDAE